MSISVNHGYSIKEKMLDILLVQKEESVSVKKELEFSFVPIKSEFQNNDFSETRGDEVTLEEFKQEYLLHESVKQEESFHYCPDNLEGCQDEHYTKYNTVPNSAEYKVKCCTGTDSTAITVYNVSIPSGSSGIGRDTESVIGQQVHKRIKKYECYECHKRFSSSSYLKIHIECVHIKIKKYKCKDCQKTFSQSGSLKSHTNSVHKGIRKYECTECHRMFSQSMHLKTHVNGVHKRINKSYECNKCHKMFSSARYIDIHIESVHEGIKKYECHYCHKMFSQSGTLKTHIESIHERIRKYQCYVCKKKFSGSNDIRRHIKMVHKILFKNVLSVIN